MIQFETTFTLCFGYPCSVQMVVKNFVKAYFVLSLFVLAFYCLEKGTVLG